MMREEWGNKKENDTEKGRISANGSGSDQKMGRQENLSSS